MLRNRNYIGGSSTGVLSEVALPSGKKATPKLFDMVLTSKITQYDIRSRKKRYYNPNALGLLLGAAQDAEKKMGSKMNSEDPNDLKLYKAVLMRSFTPDFSPMKFVVKAIDTYLSTGKLPSIAGKVGSKSYRESVSLRRRGYLAENEVLAEEMPIGKTLETSAIRVHRFASSFHVTDMTNAGKRGKKVNEFSLYDLDYIKDPKTLRLISQFASQVHRAKTYKQALAMARGVVDQFKKNPQGIGPKIQERELKGVDVAPSGDQEIVIDTPQVRIEAGYKDFLISDKRDKMNEPRTMPPQRGWKTAVKKFRVWVIQNRKAIEKMSYRELLSAMSKAGIDSHSWLAMD
jgi:hypothetical protein